MSTDPNGNPYDPNIGDGSTQNPPSVIRLRRVWDSWSTTYTNAWSSGYDPNTGWPSGALKNGPQYSPPLYTSYPPPYPAPLRAIQIQIRVVDPRNERVKLLTIRRDLSDKLSNKPQGTQQ
jgi:hypothetical protein